MCNNALNSLNSLNLLCQSWEWEIVIAILALVRNFNILINELDQIWFMKLVFIKTQLSKNETTIMDTQELENHEVEILSHVLLFRLWFDGSLMAALQVLCCALGLGLLFSSVIWHWYPVWWERKGWRRNFKTGKMEYDKTDSSGFTNTIKNSGLVGKNVKSTQGRWRVTQKAISEVYTHKEHTQVLEHNTMSQQQLRRS